MRRTVRLVFDGACAMAFLFVVAMIAPRFEPDEERPLFPRPLALAELPAPAAAPIESPTVREPAEEPATAPAALVEPPAPPEVAVAEPAAPGDPKPPEAAPARVQEPAPRVAIGFNPIEAKDAGPIPVARDEPKPGAVAPIRPDEPPPIRLGVRGQVGGGMTALYRPFWSADWAGPKVIVGRQPIDPPPPPQPALRRREADRKPSEHDVRLFWERDVEQFRALEKAGFKEPAIRLTFAAKYPDVRAAAHTEIALDRLPPPPMSYVTALGPELNGIRP